MTSLDNARKQARALGHPSIQWYDKDGERFGLDKEPLSFVFVFVGRLKRVGEMRLATRWLGGLGLAMLTQGARLIYSHS